MAEIEEALKERDMKIRYQELRLVQQAKDLQESFFDDKEKEDRMLKLEFKLDAKVHRIGELEALMHQKHDEHLAQPQDKDDPIANLENQIKHHITSSTRLANLEAEVRSIKLSSGGSAET